MHCTSPYKNDIISFLGVILKNKHTSFSLNSSLSEDTIKLQDGLTKGLNDHYEKEECLAHFKY